MKSFDEQWAEIEAGFDWEKVFPLTYNGVYGDISALKDTAYELLRWAYGAKKELLTSGQLQARYYGDGTVGLSFVIEEYVVDP